MGPEDIRFFDCNAMIGRWNTPVNGRHLTPQTLLAEMDRAGIEEALVYHAVSRQYAPTVGNSLLDEELAPFYRLHPSWAALPHWAGDMPEPRTLASNMLAAGVRAARMFPGEPLRYDHRVFMAEWVVGELLSELDANRIPLFLDFDLGLLGDPDWQMIHDLCRSHPDLPVVLNQIAYGRDRALAPLFNECPNLRCDLTAFTSLGWIEAFCQRFGAERLLFGTGVPFWVPAAVVSAVRYARISWEEKALIAGDNLRRLLEGVTHG